MEIPENIAVPENLPDPRTYPPDLYYEYLWIEETTQILRDGITPAPIGHPRRVLLEPYRISFGYATWTPVEIRWKPKGSQDSARLSKYQWGAELWQAVKAATIIATPPANDYDYRVVALTYLGVECQLLLQPTPMRHDIYGWALHSIT